MCSYARSGSIVKALEFQAHLNPDRTVTVPAELAAQLSPEESVRVILLVEEADEGQAWSRLSTEQFLKGYDDGDAIYDDIPSR